MLVIQILVCLLTITNEGQSEKSGESMQASSKEVPYIVSFEYEDKHYCSGIYIRPQWILTTAHCIRPSKMRNTTVKIGVDGENSGYTEKIKHASGRSLTVRPKPGEIVPSNVSTETLNNLGLIQLAKPFEKGPSVGMIEFASKSVDYKDVTARLIGFGKLCPNDKMVSAPRVVDFTLQGSDGFMLYPNWGKSSVGFCKGDSGSAVVLNSQIIGLVVCGYNCGPRKVILSNAILELSRHSKWIEAKIKEVATQKGVSHYCHLSVTMYIVSVVILFC